MPTENSNKRIAKNTLFLYFRMLLTMGVSLYTSRIVLNVLGIDDFGIYNVVGGVVVLFSFINSAMFSAVQRFLSFELGRNDVNEVKRVFSMSLTVHICIALIVLLLAETLGLWFLNSQMDIPSNRMSAANWVYQVSILTACIGIVQTPYNASIIAYEKMSFYAYVGIIEAILKLIVVFLLTIVAYDKLKVYSFLILLVSLIVFSAYKIYCNKTQHTSKYRFFFDKLLFNRLMNFSGWSLFGAVANVGKTQGVNILINLFLGVTGNAAFAVSNQVMNALNGFVISFQTAFNPQVVKLYAKGDLDSLVNLIFRTSKYSFLLFFAFTLPILLHTNTLMLMWLGVLPKYSVEFTQLVLLYILLETISGPLWMTVAASGRIKKYQIIISTILLLNIPISYILLKLDFTPYYVFVGMIILGFVALITRIYFLHSLINLSINHFLKKVLLRIFLVAICASPLSYLTKMILPETFLGFCLSIIFSVIISAGIIYLFGIDSKERQLLKQYLQIKLLKSNNA